MTCCICSSPKKKSKNHVPRSLQAKNQNQTECQKRNRMKSKQTKKCSKPETPITMKKCVHMIGPQLQPSARLRLPSTALRTKPKTHEALEWHYGTRREPRSAWRKKKALKHSLESSKLHEQTKNTKSHITLALRRTVESEDKS